MEEMELKIEEKLYTLNEGQLAKLGEFLKVDIGSQPSRRYKVKKLRERFELVCSEELEGGDLQRFLNDVWDIVCGNVIDAQLPNSEDSNNTTTIRDEPQPTKDSRQATGEAENTSNFENKNSTPLPVNQDGVNGAVRELLNLNLRREFKIIGSIGGDAKDKLSFVGLMRQIDNAVAKGYQESEIVDAVIRAISSSSKLKTYLEMMTNITLQKLRQILRVHYNEKTSTELYQQLTNTVQDLKESPQDFLLRVLSLRERIIFASKADNAMKYDAALVQSLFTHAVETGLRDENIRNKLRLSIKIDKATDEELMEALNNIVSVEGERQLKLNANRKENKASLSAVASDPKQSQEMSKVMSTLATLQAQIAALNAKIDSKPNFQPTASATAEPVKENQRRRRVCESCEERNIHRCNHCFKCGSDNHLAFRCNQGNGQLLRPRDRQ